MASYTKMTVGKENRTELHEKLALTGAEISLNTNISDLRIACSKELALCHGRNLQPVACCKADFFAIDNDLAFAGKNTVDFHLPCGSEQMEHLLPQEAYSG